MEKEKGICPSFGDYDITDGQCRVCSRNTQRKKLFTVCKSNTKVPNISVGNGKQIIIFYPDERRGRYELITCGCYSNLFVAEGPGKPTNPSSIQTCSLRKTIELGWIKTNHIQFCPPNKSYAWVCPDCAGELEVDDKDCDMCDSYRRRNYHNYCPYCLKKFKIPKETDRQYTYNEATERQWQNF